MTSHTSDAPRNDKVVVKEIDCGTPMLLSPPITLRFKVHNFANLEEARDNFFHTPVCKAHGYDWFLEVYPRGSGVSDPSCEFVSCYLGWERPHHETVECTFSIGCGPVVWRHTTTTKFCREEVLGPHEYIERKTVLSLSLIHI